MKITLITLNYNNAERTLALIRSLENNTDREFQLLVVDNASCDLAKMMPLIHQLPNATLIQNKENLGFGAGNNRGLDYAFRSGADWAVLINNDTTVSPDFVALLKEKLRHRQGIVGIPVTEDGQVAYGGYIEWLKAPSQMHHIYNPRAEVKDRYIIGAGLAISGYAYQTLGGIPEEYFLYYEDTAYSVMAHKKGIEVSYLLEPIISHSPSSTTSALGSPLLLRYHYRNALYFNHTLGPWWARLGIYPWSLWILIKQSLKYILGIHKRESRGIISGILDYYKGRTGIINY